MNPDRKRVVAGTIATIVCLVLAARLSLSHRYYAPGAHALQQYLANRDNFSIPLFSSYAFGNDVYFGVRKLYGTVTFTVLALCIAPLFARPQRLWRTVVLVTIARAGLEVIEAAAHRGDGVIETLFDIATGTFAGVIGALVYNAIAKRGETA